MDRCALPSRPYLETDGSNVFYQEKNSRYYHRFNTFVVARCAVKGAGSTGVAVMAQRARPVPGEARKAYTPELLRQENGV